MVQPITTERLQLRPMIPADAALLQELDRDPAVVRYLGAFQPGTLADYCNRIETVYQKYDATHVNLGFWAIRKIENGEFLGWVCLRPATDYRFLQEAGYLADDVELGYRLKQAAWGQGFATEASRAVLEQGWLTESFSRVVASALIPNRGSTRVLEKCGLLRLYEFHIAGMEDAAVVYGLTRAAGIAGKST
ncbi:GNAT family N-acetyltransferase [bacterium]|nr:GNAT family N-acetyltransferase [bacterium]